MFTRKGITFSYQACVAVAVRSAGFLVKDFSKTIVKR